MKTYGKFAALLLAATMACAPALAVGQENSGKQDMKDAGHESANAARDAGHGVKHGTKKAYHSTKRGAKKAGRKTKNTTKGAVNGGREGAHEPQ